jgi:hypothetical protein
MVKYSKKVNIDNNLNTDGVFEKCCYQSQRRINLVCQFQF